jgi:ATP-binding cassette subfamily B protein
MPGFVSVLAFAWSYWRRHGRRIFLLVLMLAGATLAEISIPVWIGRLIDALGASEPSTAVHALAVILALSLTFQVFHKGGDYLWCRLAIDVMRQIGADAFARVQRYSTQWHANTLAGATVRKITRGIWAFDDFGDALYISLLPAGAVVLGVAILTAVHWPLMGILLIAGAALYTAISTYMASAYVSRRWRYAVEADSRLGGSLADAITCIGVVKTAGAERREDERLALLLESWRQRMVRAWSAAIDTAVVQSATMLSLYLVLIGGALWLWWLGRATPGDVAFVITSFFMIDRYLRDVRRSTPSSGRRMISRMWSPTRVRRRTWSIGRAPGRCASPPARSPSSACALPIRARTGRCSTTSRSRSDPARKWRWSAIRAAARARF